MHRFIPAALLLSTLSTPCGAAEPVPTLENVPYGAHERQVLDFYKAASQGPAPLVFFIHGGGWMNGDKREEVPFLQNCLTAGISVVSINYRLLPDATAERVSPPVKASLDDAARALQFVRSRAVEWNIDPQRICASGGSAGGFTALWLAFHPDKADPTNTDPVERQSTRVACALTFVPQTSLDPRQMREWISNIDYGHHAFALPSYRDFLAHRSRLLPAIRKYSPYELVSSDDPPVYLYYDTPVAPGEAPKDPVHSANFGAGLAEKLKTAGVVFEFNHRGANVKHPDIFGFVLEHLKGDDTASAANNVPETSGTTAALFDIASDFAAIKTSHATVAETEDQGEKVLLAEFAEGAEYPQIQFPMSGERDLSAHLGVEAEITNVGNSEAKVALRVDNPGDWQMEPWNTEVESIPSGTTKTISVTFGKSHGSPGFALNPSRITALQIFVPSPTQPVKLQIRRIAPF
jgi:acetyl esterase/lipase